MTTLPTKQQITKVATAMAENIGLMNVSLSELAFQVDAQFPNISDADFALLKDVCREILGEMKTAELIRVWS